MKKRVLSLILAMSMLFGSMGGAYAVDASRFSDMPDDWSRSALERAVSNGLLSGSNGRINASAHLTRAELAAIIVRAFGTLETADLSGFSDVDPSEWYYDALQKAVAMGILSGNNGKLHPVAPITREEVCVVLHRAFILPDGGSAAQRFGDADQISGWAQAAVSAMAAKGYIAGDAWGNINASKTITRAEFAQMMDNLVKGYPTGSAGGVIEGNAVMKVGDSLAGLTIKGDLILADGLGRNDVDLSDCVVEGRIIVRGGSEVNLSGSTRTSSIVVAASVALANHTGNKIPSVSIESGSTEIGLTGTIGRVEVCADNVTINADRNAAIDMIETSASRTTIEGNGVVEAVHAKLGASGTVVTTSKTEITVDSGAGTVTSANGSLAAGQTGTTDNSGALQTEITAKPSASSDSGRRPSGSRPSGGGGGSSGDRTDSYHVTAENGQSIGWFDRGTVLTIDPENGAPVYTVTVNGLTSIATPVRSGYHFNGWLVSGRVVTAQWAKDSAPSETVAVKDSRGDSVGTFDIGTILTVDYDNDEEPFDITVSENTVIPVPEKDGYTFGGWAVDGSTITAQWIRNSVPTVEVKDSDGNLVGTFEIGTVLTIDYDNGENVFEITVSEDFTIPIPEKEGYTFIGWETDTDGTTVTAQWWSDDIPLETVTVKDSDGNTIGDYEIGTVLTIDKDDGSESVTVRVTENTIITVPERDGYLFDGWSIDKNDDTLITAEWIEDEPEEIVVTDSENGEIGTYPEGTILSVSHADGTATFKVIVSANMDPIEVPTREGYTFKGWDVQGTAVTAIWEADSPTEPEEVEVKDSNDTVIGTFAVDTVLTISNGYSGTTQTVTVATDMEAIEVPTREGYTFTEWNVEGTTITAQWNREGDVTVKDSEGTIIGTFAVGTELTIVIGDGTADETVTVTADTVVSVPEREGYAFMGWECEDTTVTAKWDKAIDEDEEGSPVDLMVAPAAETDSSITLIWDKPEQYNDVTAYYIYCNGEKIGESGPKKTHFTAYNLDSDTGYSFRVAAVRGFTEASTANLTASTKTESTVINVMDAPYNAVGNGSTKDTEAIQAAIDACPTGGTVLLPEGYTFLSGALDLKSDMTFCVDGTLKGSTAYADYETSDGKLILSRFEGWEMECFRSLINAGYIDPENRKKVTCENVTITGKGTIEGGGTSLANTMKGAYTSKRLYNGFAYDNQVYGSDGARIRGRLINLSQCSNVNIAGTAEGRLTIANPPCWTIHPIYCSNLTTHNVNVNTVGVRNGDGWDPDSSTNCMLFDAIMATGDDCVAIKSGKNPEGNDVNIPATDIRVFDMQADPNGHGLGVAIGSEMSGGVENVNIRDIDLQNTTYGIEFKAINNRGAYIRNVTVQDSRIDVLLIHSVSYNGDGAGRAVPVFSDMTFRNLEIDGRYWKRDGSGLTSCNPIELVGFSNDMGESSPVKNLVFEDITLGSARDDNIGCGNTVLVNRCDNITFNNVAKYDGTTITYNKGSGSTNIVFPENSDTTLNVQTGGKIISGATDTVAATAEKGVTVGELRSAIQDTGNKTYAFYDSQSDANNSTSPLADNVALSETGTKYLVVTAPDGSTKKTYQVIVREPIITVLFDAADASTSGYAVDGTAHSDGTISDSVDGKFFNLSNLSEDAALTFTQPVSISDGRIFRTSYVAKTGSSGGTFDVYLVSNGGAQAKIGSADLTTGKFEPTSRDGVGVPAGTYTLKFVCTAAGDFSMGTMKFVGEGSYEGGFKVNLASLSDITLVTGDPALTMPVKATPNDVEITYMATSSNTDVVTVSASGNTLTLTPVAVGESTVTVTASATGYDSATQTFKVKVSATALPFEIDIVKLASGTSKDDLAINSKIDLSNSQNITKELLGSVKNLNVTHNDKEAHSYFQVEGNSGNGVQANGWVQIETPLTIARTGNYTAKLFVKAGSNRGVFNVLLVPVTQEGSDDLSKTINLGSVDMRQGSGFTDATVSNESTSVAIAAGQYKLRFVCITAGNLTASTLTLTQTEDEPTPPEPSTPEPISPDASGMIDIVLLASGTAKDTLAVGSSIDLKNSENITKESLASNIKNLNVVHNKNEDHAYFQVEGNNVAGVQANGWVQFETPIAFTNDLQNVAITLFAKTGSNRGIFKVQLIPANGGDAIDLGAVTLKETTGTFKEVTVTSDATPVNVSAGQYKLRFVCTTAGNLTASTLTLSTAEDTTS